MISSFINAHTMSVIVAAFIALSTVLGAVSAYLTAIGDKVPNIVGEAISGLGTLIGFLNGATKL